MFEQSDADSAENRKGAHKISIGYLRGGGGAIACNKKEEQLKINFNFRKTAPTF